MLSLEDRKIFSGKRASEGLNCNFKSVSRDKKPSWGNRFVRDHNDLIYDADPHSISNKLKSSRKQKQVQLPKRNQESPSPGRKYEYSPFKSRDIKTSHSQRNIRPHTGLQLDNYLESVQEFEKKARVGQETAASTAKKRRYGLDRDNAEVEAFNEYGMQANDIRKSATNLKNPNIHQLREYEISPTGKHVNLLGLSRFEFDATIEGKLLSKSNHHIDFSRNKTTKINNTNRVWYDHSKDLDKSPEVRDKERYQSLKNTHSFRSYSSHKLFFRTKRLLDDNGCGNGGMLDKYYDLTSPEKHQVTHERPPKKVDYQKMTPRPDLPKKLGTNLDYQVQQQKTLGVGNGKRAIMQLSSSQRELVFSRQVISPTRGCFR